jgi:hypothetical protein
MAVGLSLFPVGAASAGDDVTPPTCTVVAIQRDPHVVTMAMQDTESGLASIEVVTLINATATVPDFTAGTTDPVEVTFHKDLGAKKGKVQFAVTDVAGNLNSCNGPRKF